MRAHPLGRNAAIIGEVVARHPGMVTLRSLVGGERVVAMLAGEQLPRICYEDQGIGIVRALDQDQNRLVTTPARLLQAMSR